MLATVERVTELLTEGKSLILAGDEALLRALPRGAWIGGTIPYFMSREGGCSSRTHLFVEEVPPIAVSCEARVYDVDTVSKVGVDSPEHGYTLVIVPAATSIHQSYAMNAPRYDELFFKVVAGWIAGVHLDDLGKVTPKVFCGPTGECYEDRAVAMHVTIPAKYSAQIGIVNIFRQGGGDAVSFPEPGFRVTQCVVNGVRQNFYDYITSRGVDWRLPLVADFCGAMVNVSVQGLDAGSHAVDLYAPVFEGVTYRFAAPVENYAAQFAGAIPAAVKGPVFTCNCVLNYLYGALEGRSTGDMVGPMTFGEIAYQLLNQTMVYITVAEAA